MLFLKTYFPSSLLFGSDFKKVLFLTTRCFILQIKKILFNKINIDEDFAYLIGKCISNHGELSLVDCKITKPAFETICVALGDKHVRIN